MIKICNIYNITSFCKRNIKVILKITIKLKQKIMSKLLWPKSSYILITIYFFNEYAFNECACIFFLPIIK